MMAFPQSSDDFKNHESHVMIFLLSSEEKHSMKASCDVFKHSSDQSHCRVQLIYSTQTLNVFMALSLFQYGRTTVFYQINTNSFMCTALVLCFT
jgi:hypothetical protein